MGGCSWAPLPSVALDDRVRAAAVLVEVDGTASQLGQVLRDVASGLAALVPAGRERLATGVALPVVELHEQLGPTVLDVERVHLHRAHVLPSLRVASPPLPARYVPLPPPSTSPPHPPALSPASAGSVCAAPPRL